MEFNFCHKLWVSNPYIFANQSCIAVYPRYFNLWILLDIWKVAKIYRGIRKFEFVAKTQYLFSCFFCGWIIWKVEKIDVVFIFHTLQIWCTLKLHWRGLYTIITITRILLLFLFIKDFIKSTLTCIVYNNNKNKNFIIVFIYKRLLKRWKQLIYSFNVKTWFNNIES